MMVGDVASKHCMDEGSPASAPPGGVACGLHGLFAGCHIINAVDTTETTTIQN
jgi:hypothetical protein